MIIDASSGLSQLQGSKKVLAFEDVLRSAPAAFIPDAIVQFGNGLCTKKYEHWLQTLSCPVLVLNSRPISSNPGAHICPSLSGAHSNIDTGSQRT